MYKGLTADEIEVRVWAFVVKSITIMVMTIALGVLLLVGFEEQAADLAPIDAVFLEILKAIAFMGVGTLGGIAGRKAISSAAKTIEETNDPNSSAP